MKKILNITTATILSFTIAQNTKYFLTNQVVFNTKNFPYNNLKEQNNIKWKQLDKKGSFFRLNNNVGILIEKETNDTYYVNNKGEFKNIVLNGENFKAQDFWTMNAHLAIIWPHRDSWTPAKKVYFIDDQSNFSDFPVGPSIPNDHHAFTRINDDTAVYSGSKSYLLNQNGKTVKELDHFVSYVREFNDNEVLVGVPIDGTMFSSHKWYFLNKTGQFIELDISPTIFLPKFMILNSNLILIQDSLDKNLYFFDSLGSKTKFNNPPSQSIIQDYFNCQDYKNAFKINDNRYLIINTESGKGYFLDNLGNLTNIDSDFINKTDIKYYSLNANIGIIEYLNKGETELQSYFFNYKGDMISLNKSGEHYTMETFVRLNNNVGIFRDKDSNLYFLYPPVDPKDIDELKNSLNFNTTISEQKLIDVNTPKFQGKLTNKAVSISITDVHVLTNFIVEIDIDNIPQPLNSKSFNMTIASEGKHKIIIKNNLTEDLIYELYIKTESTTTNITNTTDEKLSAYVGIDNKGNLLDILNSTSEVLFSFNDILLSTNKLNTLDNNFNITNTIDILDQDKFHSVGKYLITTTDLIGNVSNQYLTLGKLNIIPNYFDTPPGKLVETEALKHKYTDEVLRNLNSKAVQRVIDQYNSKIWDQKLSLDDIKSLSLKNNTPDKTKTYKDLMQSILNAPEFNGLTLTNPVIQFLDMNNQVITNDNEKQGQFKVQIQASDNDPNWTGQTGLIVLDLKTDLLTLEKLDLTDLIADENKTYNDLSTIILNSDIFKNFKLLNPTIIFMDMSGQDIGNNHEILGKFQVQIQASDNDPNWTGQTGLIVLDLGSNLIPIDPDTKVDPSNNSVLLFILGIGLPVILIVATTTGAMFYRKRSSKIKIKHDK